MLANYFDSLANISEKIPCTVHVRINPHINFSNDVVDFSLTPYDYIKSSKSSREKLTKEEEHILKVCDEFNRLVIISIFPKKDALTEYKKIGISLNNCALSLLEKLVEEKIIYLRKTLTTEFYELVEKDSTNEQ